MFFIFFWSSHNILTLLCNWMLSHLLSWWFYLCTVLTALWYWCTFQGRRKWVGKVGLCPKNWKCVTFATHNFLSSQSACRKSGDSKNRDCQIIKVIYRLRRNCVFLNNFFIKFYDFFFWQSLQFFFQWILQYFFDEFYNFFDEYFEIFSTNFLMNFFNL